MTPTALAARLLPPILVDGARYLLGRKRAAPAPPPAALAPLPEWEYVPQGWEREGPPAGGWDQPGVSGTYAAKWQRFLDRVAGTAPLGVNHEAVAPGNDCFDTHNNVMALAYAVARVARGKESLSVLDFGGALGHHLAILRALLPEVSFDFSCCEVPRVAEEGRKLNPDVYFYQDDSWASRSYDLVMASNSLQYVRDWGALLGRFARAATTAVYVTKLPVAVAAPSFVVLQRAWAYGYRTEYLGWCLNEQEFLAAARGDGLRLRREFLAFARDPVVPGAPENPRYKGYLFDKEAHLP